MSTNPLNELFLEQRSDNVLKTCDFAIATGGITPHISMTFLFLT